VSDGGGRGTLTSLTATTTSAAFEQFLNPIQSDGFVDLMVLPARDLWTSIGARFSRSGFEQVAEVAPRVLTLPATQAHQERLNKHLRRIIRACGTQLADRTEFARPILSACADLPTDLRTSSPTRETREAVIVCRSASRAAHRLWL
jgi:hypothetical protein